MSFGESLALGEFEWGSYGKIDGVSDVGVTFSVRCRGGWGEE